MCIKPVWIYKHDGQCKYSIFVALLDYIGMLRSPNLFLSKVVVLRNVQNTLWTINLIKSQSRYFLRGELLTSPTDHIDKQIIRRSEFVAQGARAGLLKCLAVSNLNGLIPLYSFGDIYRHLYELCLDGPFLHALKLSISIDLDKLATDEEKYFPKASSTGVRFFAFSYYLAVEVAARYMNTVLYSEYFDEFKDNHTIKNFDEIDQMCSASAEPQPKIVSLLGNEGNSSSSFLPLVLLHWKPKDRVLLQRAFDLKPKDVESLSPPFSVDFGKPLEAQGDIVPDQFWNLVSKVCNVCGLTFKKSHINAGGGMIGVYIENVEDPFDPKKEDYDDRIRQIVATIE